MTAPKPFSSHQPGPWVVRGYAVETEDGKFVANCAPDCAKLIAAAPELIDLLGEFVESAKSFSDSRVPYVELQVSTATINAALDVLRKVYVDEDAQ